MLVWPNIGFAFDLGQLQVQSRLNQPLNAYITIRSTTNASIDDLTVRFASLELFAQRGLTRAEQLDDIRLSIKSSATPGNYLLLLQSDRPISKPSLTLLLEASWSQGQLLRAFTLSLAPSRQASAATDNDIAVEYELDPYYTNAGLFIPLTRDEMKQVDIENEGVIYNDLLASAISPRFLVIEASINPLPILGTYLKDQHDSFYQKADVSDDLNLIQALTEGFEEPYALSMFLGNVIRFTSARSRIFRAINKGYSGFLVSVGDQHIKDSELIDDNWYEVEWKIKGDRRIDTVYHSWSFRIGSKIHDNSDIADVNYLGFRRELFNDKPGEYHWHDNIGIEYSIYFARETGDAVQQQLYVEKRWPMVSGEFSLGIGLNKIEDKYAGELADEENETRLILRPGLSF